MRELPTEHLRLDTLPEDTVLRSVTAAPGAVDGRAGTRVALTEEVARYGKPGVDYVDQPTMALLPLSFATGQVSVDIHSQLSPDAPDYARGFAGIAFHVTPELDRFESVYVRPTNGTLTEPGPPREDRGIQYFAYPDWPFDRLRDEYPPGTYETAAPIAPARWLRLSVDVTADRITASVDNTEILHIQNPLAPPSLGAIGLFVDIGTDAHFANLTITPR
ncbi:hypothetical protein ACTXLB_16590 [Brachybacterium tyrofermentans]|uniref:hypothetical protein n=1 Tax=Brachybacterium tyrofermentans TaxID=47848 RepID=UPI003FD427DC